MAKKVKKVKNLIRVELARMGIGQQEFADALSVTRVTVSRWINNQQQPTLEKLQEIADFFKVDICDLIERGGAPALIRPNDAAGGV